MIIRRKVSDLKAAATGNPSMRLVRREPATEDRSTEVSEARGRLLSRMEDDNIIDTDNRCIRNWQHASGLLV